MLNATTLWKIPGREHRTWGTQEPGPQLGLSCELEQADEAYKERSGYPDSSVNCRTQFGAAPFGSDRVEIG